MKILIEEFSLLKFKIVKLALPVFQNQVLVGSRQQMNNHCSAISFVARITCIGAFNRFLMDYGKKTSRKQLMLGIPSKYLSILHNFKEDIVS